MTQLNPAFACLADPVRRAILERLARGEATVQDLARPFGISQPAISRHLRLLEEAGLIESRIDGTSRPRRLKPDAVDQLWAWLSDLRATWDDTFNRLEDVLDDMERQERKPPSPSSAPLKG